MKYAYLLYCMTAPKGKEKATAYLIGEKTLPVPVMPGMTFIDFKGKNYLVSALVIRENKASLVVSPVEETNFILSDSKLPALTQPSKT